MNEIRQERTWTCFLCQSEHPNTLCYCPKCNIAKLHSNNLFKSAELKKKKKENIRHKRYQDFKKRKKREMYK